jgi:two-component system, sensor histidine kinase RpfC
MAEPAKSRFVLAPEQEILLNRLVMGSTAGIAIYFLAFDAFILSAFACYLSCNAALFIMRRGQVWRDEWRWIAAICLDVAMAYVCMSYKPEQLSAFYPIMLWAILGNGFRYGVKYLAIASIMLAIAFGSIVMTASYWAQNSVLGWSLTAALIVIPAYCSTLIKKLSKAKDAAEAANRAKGYFLASVSHELRTPLNAIIGYGNHLRQMALPKNQHDMVDASVLAGEHLLQLIDQLIQIARSDSGTAEIAFKPMRLTDMLAEIREIMMVRADEKSLALQLSADPLSDALVDAPADIIRNVLLNLTGNAIKFTESGSVAIHGSVEIFDERKANLIFSVTDTGIGIAPEAVEKIFEPFQQADDTVMNRFGGTGLGLAICKQLVAQVGGKLAVESTIGLGSSFKVIVPVKLASDESAAICSDDALIRIMALGQFDDLLLATAQAAGNYLVHSLPCTDRQSLIDCLNQNDGASYDIAMVDEDLAHSLEDDDPVWRDLADAEVAVVLVSNRNAPDLAEVSLRAAFATVIPSDASFDQMRSAIRIGRSFAHKPNFAATDEVVQPAAQVTYSGKSILVADDNRTNRNILAAILETAGHGVTQVCDGDEMLEILEKQQFDIVLLDVNMPRLNGIDACRMWRQIEGNRSHLPIVGVTADATSETETRCLAAGMDLRLTKPINAKLLLETIASYCNGSDTANELPSKEEDPLQKIMPLSATRGDQDDAINSAHIEYLYSIGDAAFVEGMIDGFLEDVAESRASMQQAISEQDPVRFRFAAHSFKSSSNNIGASHLAALCGKLEKITEAEFASDGVAHFARVEAELEKAVVALRPAPASDFLRKAS